MANKRLIKEVNKLIFEQNSKQNVLDNNYLVAFDEQNINRIFAIIKAPFDSVYRHKFIRLNFDIPTNYPHSPPNLTFINYDGVRINPMMYSDGKCCATILNTWPSNVSADGNKMEAWTSSMGIETIILTFQSFLDNNPYMLEPGGRDDPSYTRYVLFQTWKTCLIRYLDAPQPQIFKEFMNTYILTNIEQIFKDLREFNERYPPGRYYTACFETDEFNIDYNNIIQHLEYRLQYIDYKQAYDSDSDYVDFDEFVNTSYKCQICFDTNESEGEAISLLCGHTYHTGCLNNHIKCNGNLCSLCRKNIEKEDLDKILPKEKEIIVDSIWTVNPDTGRRIKIGGKTYLRLISENKIMAQIREV